MKNKKSYYIETTFDVDEITNNKTVTEQLDYIFMFVEDLITVGKYDLIDESINVFLKNGVDFRIDIFIGFLTACFTRKEKIKNYNKLYHESFLYCMKKKSREETNQILVGLGRSDYHDWIRSQKISRITKRIH